MDRNSLLNPTTYFGLACVAFSVVAAASVWRNNATTQAIAIPTTGDQKQKILRSKGSSSQSRPKAHRRVAVDSLYAQSGDQIYETIQESLQNKEEAFPSHSDALSNLIQSSSQLVQQLGSPKRAGESRIVVASLTGELSLLTTSLCRLKHDVEVTSGNTKSFEALEACFNAATASLGTTFALLDSELMKPVPDQSAVTVALQQLRDQRPAVEFLLKSWNASSLPPTPPSEFETDAVQEDSANPISTGLTPGADTRAWIEPPPEYSPPSKGPLAAAQEKDSDVKAVEPAPPEEQPQTEQEEYTVDVLYNAVTDNDVDLVSELLTTHGANPNDTMGEFSRTPLHQAAHLNLISCIGVLLKHGAIMNIEDAKGDTPLHLAAWSGNVEALTALLAHNPDPDCVDWLSGRDGYSPLWCAISAYHIDAARLLLRHGARVSLRSTSGAGLMPLHQAAVTGQSAMCELLLDRGAQVDSIDDDRNTPLHYASASGSLKTVKILLQNGAQVDSQQTQGLTPIHWAAHKGHVDVVAVLITCCGGSIPASFPRTEGHATPLHLAANRGHLNVVRLLVEKSAGSGRAQQLAGEAEWDGVHGTPADLALAKGHTRVAEFLRNSSKSAV